MLLAIGLLLDLSYVYFFPEFACRKNLPPDIALAIQMALVTSWGLCVFGALLVKTGTRKEGFLLVVMGSLLFFPLGLLAILGAYRLKCTQPDSALSLRRKALMQSRQIAADQLSLQEGPRHENSLDQGLSQAEPPKREYV